MMYVDTFPFVYELMSLINKHLDGDYVMHDAMLGSQEKMRQIQTFKKFTAEKEAKTIPK